MRVRAGIIGATLLALVAASTRAAAEGPRGAAVRALVELVLEVDPPDRIIGTTLEQHLRAELRARDIDLAVVPTSVPAPGARPAGPKPIARVTLHVEHQANGAFLATIRVGDLIMDKRVERTIDLGRLPADARPLAVAASTDELLRASWVELTIADAPSPILPPPPAVLRALAAPARSKQKRPSIVEIGAVATATDFFGHRVGLGGQAWFGLWCLSRLMVELRFGADAGLARKSPHGSVRADAFGPGAALVVSFMDHDAPFGVRLEAGADALRVHLTGSASGAATVSDGWHWTGVAGGMVRGWARTGRISWTVGIGAVAALHTVAATDDGAPVTSIQGASGKVEAGIILPF